MKQLILFVSVFLAPTSANAHSFWLEPDKHRPTPGENVTVEFKVGDIGTKAEAWGLYWERIGALRLIGPDQITDLQPRVRTTTTTTPGTVTFAAPKAGTHILAFASNPSFSDFEAARFNRYLDHQGLTAIAADRKARGAEAENGTELYARRAKALIQVGANSTENLLKPIGQTLEIVPVTDPFEHSEPTDLTVMVLWRGKPLPGASLMIARGGGENGVEEVHRTDAEGRAVFEYHPGSRYLLSVVWGEPAPNDKRADFFTIFSSLTF